jgi:hypothetical protein
MPDGQVDTIWTFNLSEHSIQYLLCKTRPKGPLYSISIQFNYL